MAEARTIPWRRLAVTLITPLAVAVISRWPLPVMHLAALERMGADIDRTLYGPFAFGLNPIVTAFLAIEVVALIVPRWRPLRHGGLEKRARLRRLVRPVALALVALQTFFFFRWMQRADTTFPGVSINPQSTAGWLVMLAALMAGPFVLLWLADLISKRGLGNGMSVLIAAAAIPDSVAGLPALVRKRLDSGEQQQLVAPLALTAMVIVALAAATARRPAEGWRERPPRPTLLAPVSALLPLSVCFALLALPTQLAAFTQSAGLGAAAQWLAGMSPAVAAVRFALLAALGVAFSWLFARPSLLAPAWLKYLRGGGTDDAHAEASVLARAAFQSALFRALAFLGALGFVVWLDSGAKLAADAVTLLVVACAALDVAGELRFRSAHREVAVLTAEHRLYAVGPVLAALADAGIAHFPRALRHRTLLAFWGPYLPVEILVSRSQADLARALLDQ